VGIEKNKSGIAHTHNSARCARNKGFLNDADVHHVNVIVANWNGGTLVENCLRSLFETRFPSFDVTVVDNASTDGSSDLIAARFPAVNLIRLPRNLGYAAANNTGIRAGTGKYVVLLNSDTEVEPEWLVNLVQVAERMPDAVFLQPKILFLDKHNVLNSAGNGIHIAGFGVCRGIGSPDIGQYDQIDSIGYASGACVMVSRDALEKIGLLDEVFFAYGEDKDWGWRGKMLGYRSLYVPTARVYHKWSAVLGWSPMKMYYLELERIVSICKNYSTGTIILLSPILLIVEVAVLIHALARGWMTHKVLSYAHALALRGEISRRRRQLSLARKIPDRCLIREFVFDLQHPYIGILPVPLNKICRFYRRLILCGETNPLLDPEIAVLPKEG
jgi:GT2 family glycosyltransferase